MLGLNVMNHFSSELRRVNLHAREDTAEAFKEDVPSALILT